MFHPYKNASEDGPELSKKISRALFVAHSQAIGWFVENLCEKSPVPSGYWFKEDRDLTTGYHVEGPIMILQEEDTQLRIMVCSSLPSITDFELEEDDFLAGRGPAPQVKFLFLEDLEAEIDLEVVATFNCTKTGKLLSGPVELETMGEDLDALYRSYLYFIKSK